MKIRASKIINFIFLFALLFAFIFSNNFIFEPKLVEAATIPGMNATDTDAVSLSSSSAILYNIDENQVLYEKNAHQTYQPGGVAKVLTADIAFSPSLMVDQNLIYYLMMDAGSDAGTMLANDIAGSEDVFVQQMNEYAKSLGCENSSFADASGNSENTLVSAYDMALIGKDAYQKSKFRSLISVDTYTLPQTDRYDTRTLWQQDQMLYTSEPYYYAYTTGGRLGYSLGDGVNFIAFAEKNGTRLVAVVMNAPENANVYEDAKSLFEYGFSNFKTCKPLEKFEIAKGYNTSSLMYDNFYYLTDSIQPTISFDRNYSLFTTIDFDESRISESVDFYANPNGKEIGTIHLLLDGEEIGSTPITVISKVIDTSTVSDATSTDVIIQHIEKRNYIIRVFIIIGIVIVLVLIITLLLIHRYRTRFERVKIHYQPSKASKKELAKKEAVKKKLANSDNTNKKTDKKSLKKDSARVTDKKDIQ